MHSVISDKLFFRKTCYNRFCILFFVIEADVFTNHQMMCIILEARLPKKMKEASFVIDILRTENEKHTFKRALISIIMSVISYHSYPSKVVRIKAKLLCVCVCA